MPWSFKTTVSSTAQDAVPETAPAISCTSASAPSPKARSPRDHSQPAAVCQAPIAPGCATWAYSDRYLSGFVLALELTRSASEPESPAPEYSPSA